VLDIGCGFGRHLLHLLRADPHISGAGVDISAPSIGAATAEARLYGLGRRATFIVGDASDLKMLQLGKFDIAICMANTLGNMPTAKQRRLIRTVSTVLKPSGLILFSVYSVASIASRLESYRAIGLSVHQRGTQIVAEEGLVSYSFSSSELRSLINVSGLSTVGEVDALGELGWQVVARN
jgi:SAM-dependent methyltransferase